MNEPTVAIPPRDPSAFFTLPLEAWTLRDLTNALGSAKTQELFDTSRGNVRVLRHRNTTSADRMQLLYAAIRKDEPKYRAALVSLYTGWAARRQSATKEPTQ